MEPSSSSSDRKNQSTLEPKTEQQTKKSKGSIYQAKYREKNKSILNEKNAIYRKNQSTLEPITEQQTKKSKVSIKNARYYEKNKSKVDEKSAKYRKNASSQEKKKSALKTSAVSERKVELIRKRIAENLYEASFQVRQETILDAEKSIKQHYCGLMNEECKHCGALHFKAEKKNNHFMKCCRNGKLKLVDEKPYPKELEDLLSCKDMMHSKDFRQNIRKYNSALSFASMGTTIKTNVVNGPPVLTIHGGVYHSTQSVVGDNEIQGNKLHNQLYMIDTEEATNERLSHNANRNLNRSLLNQLDHLIRRDNEYAKTYKMMREVIDDVKKKAISENSEISQVNLAFIRNPKSDERRFNLPLMNSIAAVFTDQDGVPPFNRDFQVYSKCDDAQSTNENPRLKLNILSAHLEGMCYPLLNPHGELGWEPFWKSKPYDGVQNNPKRDNVSKLQYVSAILSVRRRFNSRLHAGKLTQQYIIDMYTQIEANNLNYIKTHQSRLRAESYSGLCDYINKKNSNLAAIPGVPIILPSSFDGSPRNMRERCADTMTMFAHIGPPDLFITMTANKEWPEIKESLETYEKVEDRPDVVARVFQQKVDELIKVVCKDQILGKCLGYAYSIEFQKRGLPHIHLLVTLDDEFKFTSPERIDEVISAEIPNEITCPRLFEIVTKKMIHGPHGKNYLQCMDNPEKKCSKKFPKAFREKTTLSCRQYPFYRRSKNIVQKGEKTFDNRFVIPYNAELLLRFNSHINVEVCTSLKAVKYIYKYIYKGYDCVNFEMKKVVSDSDLAEVIENPNRHNEILDYQSARFVGPVEAMWRILEFSMHRRSRSISHLAVHLEDQQRVTFIEGCENAAMQKEFTSTLLAWFELNKKDEEARNYLYTEIPLHYIFPNETKKWQKRKNATNVIPRMYQVNPRDGERFYLRLLLLHRRGATSFTDLKTVDNVICETFFDAAKRLNLLASDNIWEEVLEEAVMFQMPSQLRDTFAYILLFNDVTDALKLWNKFKEDFAFDYLNNREEIFITQTPHDEDVAFNYALHEIDDVLRIHGKNCADFRLPEPTGNSYRGTTNDFSIDEEHTFSKTNIPLLNVCQKKAFDMVDDAINSNDRIDKLFYIDGPGGTGKTFLYKVLLSKLRSEGRLASAYAFTGIASNLLSGGRTIHSGFKLPLNLHESAVSSMSLKSEQARSLFHSKLIVIDEISMLPKHGLRCIDRLLRDIMSNPDLPFGGKVIVVGGDFRQTLPVVPHAGQRDIIENCVKSSDLWKLFKKFSLQSNMRSFGKNEHNNWLLKIGSGSTSKIRSLSEESVELPAQMILKDDEDIIFSVYGDINKLTETQISQRVILAPTNAEVNMINQSVVSTLDGEEVVYTSFDSIISDNPDDPEVINFPIEYLNSLTVAGTPPHKLILKAGTVIMLIRNLNSKKGLCNGTRLTVVSLQKNIIKAKILNDDGNGEEVLIPRISMSPNDVSLPFKFQRIQFPIIVAYAITINKSQGQSFDYVGISLDKPVFAHGQLYVALSRCRDPQNIKIKLKATHSQGKLIAGRTEVYTSNIVYKEILK